MDFKPQIITEEDPHALSVMDNRIDRVDRVIFGGLYHGYIARDRVTRKWTTFTRSLVPFAEGLPRREAEELVAFG